MPIWLFVILSEAKDLLPWSTMERGTSGEESNNLEWILNIIDEIQNVLSRRYHFRHQALRDPSYGPLDESPIVDCADLIDEKF